MTHRIVRTTGVLGLMGWLLGGWGPAMAQGGAGLERIRMRDVGVGFETVSGKPFTPFGVNYYRPGTGWAPQVWKKFDAEATRRDLARLKEMGGNCVRVFLTFGSFYPEPGRLDEAGLAKFELFLTMAEEAGIYVHPTGPDHWEGLPEWARGDRYADETFLAALEAFWSGFAARHRGRGVLLAYDLLNEPSVPWETPALRVKWAAWLRENYGSIAALEKAWATNATGWTYAEVPVPPSGWAPGSRPLLDYHRFRESVADAWTRRQVAAIKAADPQALVTVGLIQWSVPVVLPGPLHYSAFRPERQAPFLDFLSVHFYPLAQGAYEYGGPEEEARNLAYLESVIRAVVRPGKSVVIGEFGWYGGESRPTFDQGRHPPATEAQQAAWCRAVVTSTSPWVSGWLNWGFYDQPEARDVSQLTGLLTVDGREKAWGRTFRELSQRLGTQEAMARGAAESARPELNWDDCLLDPPAAARFREEYLKA